MDAARTYIRERILIEDRGYSSPCWIWQRAISSSGYGSARAPGCSPTTLAHRHSYEAFVGPIPAGLQIDHLCRCRVCVNPAHLEPVSRAENMRRAFFDSLSRTHCGRGHEFTAGNTITYRGYRRCRACWNVAYQNWVQRKKAAVQENLPGGRGGGGQRPWVTNKQNNRTTNSKPRIKSGQETL